MKKILFLVFLLTLSVMIVPISCADPTVIIDDYELSPTVFMPGDIGILTLTIKNAETTNTVVSTIVDNPDSTVRTDTVGAILNNIWIVYDSDSNSKKVKATSNYEDVSGLAPGASITVEFEIIAESNITEGEYFPTARIDVQTYSDVSHPIRVKVSNATVNLLLADVPSKISMSGSTSIILTAVNNRENPVDGLTIVPESTDGLQFTPTSVYIGRLDAHASSNATFSIKPSETGEKNITFYVHFKNGDNDHSETYTSSIEVIDTLDVGSVFTSIPRSIKKGGSSRITLEVYNAKTESITGVMVTPISNTTILPSQYFIGSMEPDDVFSATFNIYTDKIDIGTHSIDFEVSFKQGNEYYKTPTISTSYSVVSGEGSTYQPNEITSGDAQGQPFGNILAVCLPIIGLIVALIIIIFILRWKKRRNNK